MAARFSASLLFTSRFAVLTLALLGHWVSGSQAQARELSAEEVASLALRQDPERVDLEEAAALIEAELAFATIRANPVIALEREHVPRADSEDTLALAFPLDVSPRRSVLAKLARADTALAAAREVRRNSATLTRALFLFYQVIAAERRVAVQRRAVARLEAAAEIVAKRRKEGTVSGYELTRIELARELARGTLERTQFGLSRQQHDLQVMLGVIDEHVVFRGDLKVDAGWLSQAAEHPRKATRTLELLRQAQSAAAAAERDSNAFWLPEFSLSAGVRVLRGDVAQYGYTAGISVELPVFSRGQGLRALAQARARFAPRRRAQTERHSEIQLRSARVLLKRALLEAERFRSATRARLVLMERAVMSGYREGERTLVELLDASSARTKVELGQLELELRAKLAEITLRAARGEFE